MPNAKFLTLVLLSSLVSAAAYANPHIGPINVSVSGGNNCDGASNRNYFYTYNGQWYYDPIFTSSLPARIDYDSAGHILLSFTFPLLNRRLQEGIDPQITNPSEPIWQNEVTTNIEIVLTVAYNSFTPGAAVSSLHAIYQAPNSPQTGSSSAYPYNATYGTYQFPFTNGTVVSGSQTNDIVLNNVQINYTGNNNTSCSLTISGALYGTQ